MSARTVKPDSGSARIAPAVAGAAQLSHQLLARAHNERRTGQEWAASLSEDELHTLVDLPGKLTAHSTHFDARHRA
ncbi:hypothetical protein [Streptomyces curacoi]|uniref:Uncharacterized protein n=1 Tax=Streptomyces curacoi TaxID=146536 RepID=A0A124GZM8_9ACTN|nr:hypothetical protein [Streptomyces curacoi]KUM73205.1 hypothetical protein AQI70_20735 [Streptomyces curacoi]